MDATTAQSLLEDSVFFLEVLDDVDVLTIDPARKHHQQELERLNHWEHRRRVYLSSRGRIRSFPLSLGPTILLLDSTAWREQFARQLREHGIAANATDRAVRGQSQKAKRTGIYRASLRGDSTYFLMRAGAVAKELLKGDLPIEPGKGSLIETRKAIESGWRGVARLLAKDGELELARDVTRYVDRMPPPGTDREQFIAALHKHLHRPLSVDKSLVC